MLGVGVGRGMWWWWKGWLILITCMHYRYWFKLFFFLEQELDWTKNPQNGFINIASVKVENRINKDLSGLNDWLKANRLSLNTVKSEYIIIGSAQRINKLKADPNLLIENVKLKRVKSKKILGVVIDQSLGWHDHIDSVCKKVKRVLVYCEKFGMLYPAIH